MLLSTISLLAQKNSVSGVVIDKETKLPVPFANIFFAHTTIGASSDQNGKYKLEGFASGKYDLIVTFVGYTNFQQTLEFNDDRLYVSVGITQNSIILNEVVVREDTTDRVKNFLLFKKLFLGETTNSQRCKIINPSVIHLFFDAKTKVLVAHAKEPIQIENSALGYSLNYYLYNFEYDFNSERLAIFGTPSFQNLKARNKLQTNRWNNQRERAYYGSMNHFLRAFLSNQLKQAGFEVKKLYQIPNHERPPQHFLDAKIKMFNVNHDGSKVKIVNEDSLRFYMKLQSLPILVDSLANSELQTSELLTSDKYIKYKGLLSVIYKKELEEYGYFSLAGRARPGQQRSVMHFLSDSLRIYPNGYYEDQKSIFIENYWAWNEKISNYLPNDYQPIVKQKNK